MQPNFHFIFLSQFRWGKPGTFEIKNIVVENFDQFAKNVCKWVQVKIFPKIDKSYGGGDEEDDEEFGGTEVTVNVQDYAVNAIWTWGDVFCGFGAYSVQEVFFRAGQLCYPTGPRKVNLIMNSGLSPFLTTLEVSTNPSRLSQLLLAMYQFAKFDIEDLWCVLTLISSSGF